MSLFRVATRQARLPGVRYFLGNPNARPRVAVVLSGCGVYDGSEIHEASAVLCHLSRAGAGVGIFAPFEDAVVVDHTNGKDQLLKRNMMVEAARIARGEIRSLSMLQADDYEAVIFPGGFGAAKHLSTFATEGENCSVHNKVAEVISSFHAKKKPLGMICVAPALAAKVLSDKGITVTLGGESEGKGRWPYCGMVEPLKKLATHEPKDVTQVCVDEENLIVSTPAFMCNAPLHIIHDAIGHFVDIVINLTRPS